MYMKKVVVACDKLSHVFSVLFLPMPPKQEVVLHTEKA